MEPKEQRRRRETILASAYDPEADADEGEEIFANGKRLLTTHMLMSSLSFDSISWPFIFTCSLPVILSLQTRTQTYVRAVKA